MIRDSGSDRDGEDAQAAECEASQSGSAKPDHRPPSSSSTPPPPTNQLAERLERQARHELLLGEPYVSEKLANLALKAASSLSILQSDVERLTAALQPLASIRVHKGEDDTADVLMGVTVADVRRAKAALTTHKEGDAPVNLKTHARDKSDPWPFANDFELQAATLNASNK